MSDRTHEQLTDPQNQRSYPLRIINLEMLHHFQFWKIGGQGLWFPVLALTAFGLLFVYSASSIYASERFSDEFFFVRKQGYAILLGLFAAVGGLLLNIRAIVSVSPFAFWASLILVLCTKVPGIGHQVNGAWRWIQLGPMTIQPAEIAKIAAIFYASAIVEKHPKHPLRLTPIFLLFPCLLLQPDFGTTVVLIVALAVILFVHGLPLRFFAIAAGLVLPMIAALLIFAPYRMRRLTAFLDPFADPLGSGFQVIQSYLAIASGGFFGKGLGNSTQKLFFLPEAHTDFVVAVIGEEMGFAGIFVLLAIIGVFLFSLISILAALKNQLHRIVCAGLFAVLAGNTMVNLGVVAGVLPTKGLPLPFVSAGGTSYIFSMFAVGIFGQAYHKLHNNTERSLL